MTPPARITSLQARATATYFHYPTGMAIKTTQVNENKLALCETLINYTFTNKFLLLQALNNSGKPILYANQLHLIPQNKALAILGDAQLQVIMCHWWWDNSSSQVPGEWAAIHRDKLSNVALNVLGRQIGLDACVILNPGTAQVSKEKLATAVEAVLGAVYEDGGEEVLEGVMRSFGFDRHMFFSERGRV
jgi:ribonuclease-3